MHEEDLPACRKPCFGVGCDVGQLVDDGVWFNRQFPGLRRWLAGVPSPGPVSGQSALTSV
jgi:hypothetical protein